jgi:hypothetical protein
MLIRLLLLLILIAPVSAQAMTVEEAYAAIPHSRTVFDPQHVSMSEEEAVFLAEFFDLIDAAIVARVGAIQGGRRDGLEDVLPRLRSLNIPPSAAQAHALVVGAVEEQNQFLKTVFTGGNIAGDPLVSSASTKLHQAYDALMTAYPGEIQHNKTAFFDYLCALDFI